LSFHESRIKITPILCIWRQEEGKEAKQIANLSKILLLCWWHHTELLSIVSHEKACSMLLKSLY
jgi:hypothetical protein